MPLRNLNAKGIKRLEDLLQKALIQLGGSAGNSALRAIVSDQITEKRYWAIRERLIDKGLLETGKGRGGSIRIVPDQATYITDSLVNKKNPSEEYQKEIELYEPILTQLKTGAWHWAENLRYSAVHVEITGAKGNKNTGGKWSQPDLAAFCLSEPIYLPGKFFDIITFEVKVQDAVDVTTVYEALAHRRAATRSYVWVLVSKEETWKEKLELILPEAEKFGVGVISGLNPNDSNTWTEEAVAKMVPTDPMVLNAFITSQFKEKEELLKMAR